MIASPGQPVRKRSADLTYKARQDRMTTRMKQGGGKRVLFNAFPEDAAAIERLIAKGVASNWNAVIRIAVKELDKATG